MALTNVTHRLASSARRYGWIAYWLAFASYTVGAARSPGFIAHPEAAPYPWVAALLMCALLGAETAALNAVLHPLSPTRSWMRVAAASGLALVFAAFGVVTMVTDMPGYYYAPGLFALANVVVVPIVGSVLALFPARRDERD
jgi:hypothetical protein